MPCVSGASDRTNIGFCNDTLWVKEVVFSVEINVRFVPKAVIPTSERGLVDGWHFFINSMDQTSGGSRP